MPNTNTVAQALSAVGGRLPSDAGGASSTAEFQFSKSSSVFSLIIPGSDKLKNRPIRIKAWGRVTGGTTTNLTVQIYSGAAFATGTSIATTGAIAANSLSGSFELECKGIWDSTSDKFQSKYEGRVNATAKTDTIGTSVTVPALDPSSETWSVCATGTFSASNASNAAILDGLEVEVL